MDTHIKILIGVTLVFLVAGLFVLGKRMHDTGGVVACTLEAKVCPDGSYVGRSGPSCEFAACPNSLENLPEEYTQKQNIPIDQDTTQITLEFQDQGLQEVPSGIFNAVATEVLDLSTNNLTSLPAEMRHFKNLKTLDVSDNNLTNIPAELGQLSELEILNLRNNNLTGLPYELGNLQNLKTLDLRGNNYARADLEIITQSLPSGTEILVD